MFRRSSFLKNPRSRSFFLLCANFVNLPGLRRKVKRTFICFWIKDIFTMDFFPHNFFFYFHVLRLYVFYVFLIFFLSLCSCFLFGCRCVCEFVFKVFQSVEQIDFQILVIETKVKQSSFFKRGRGGPPSGSFLPPYLLHCLDLDLVLCFVDTFCFSSLQ